MKDIKNKTFIHYGHDRYYPEKFNQIWNGYPKPSGGLWASPMYSKWGWYSWCKYESKWRVRDRSFKFKLKKKSRIYEIHDYKDLKVLPIYYPVKDAEMINTINFESMKTYFDAIFLSVKGQQETRFSAPRNLYGWDCESIFIMNKDIIEPVNK